MDEHNWHGDLFARISRTGRRSTATTARRIGPPPECGENCISVFSSDLGTYADPGCIETVLDGGAAKIGQTVGLKPASDTDPSQDFKPGAATNMMGTVSDFYADEMVSAEANSR